MIHRIRASCLFRAFSCWQDRASDRMAAKQRLAQAVAALKKGQLLRSWAAWLDFIDARLAAKGRMLSAVAHWGKRMAMACFKRWVGQMIAGRAMHQKGRELLRRIMTNLKAGPRVSPPTQPLPAWLASLTKGQRSRFQTTKGAAHRLRRLCRRESFGTAGGMM